MRELFEEVARDGSAAIHRWVEDRYQENVQLDFKQKARAQHGELDKEDRVNLGPALSALANSAGGLLILGVEANKDNPDKIDQAFARRPIKDIARFKAEAVRATADLLMPRHSGIEVLAVGEPASPGWGYLAIWVERSERRPHRSEAIQDKRYYKRVGDSSFIMEHYDVEDAFRRASAPVLELEISRVWRPHHSEIGPSVLETFEVHFSLKNVGAVSARAPYVLVERCTAGELQNLPDHELDMRSTTAHSTMFAAASSVLLHPDLELPAFKVKLDIVRSPSDGWKLLDNGTEFALSIECGFGCEDARMVRRVMTWRNEELVRLLQRFWGAQAT